MITDILLKSQTTTAGAGGFTLSAENSPGQFAAILDQALDNKTQPLAPVQAPLRQQHQLELQENQPTLSEFPPGQKELPLTARHFTLSPKSSSPDPKISLLPQGPSRAVITAPFPPATAGDAAPIATKASSALETSHPHAVPPALETSNPPMPDFRLQPQIPDARVPVSGNTPTAQPRNQSLQHSGSTELIHHTPGRVENYNLMAESISTNTLPTRVPAPLTNGNEGEQRPLESGDTDDGQNTSADNTPPALPWFTPVPAQQSQAPDGESGPLASDNASRGHLPREQTGMPPPQEWIVSGRVDANPSHAPTGGTPTRPTLTEIEPARVSDRSGAPPLLSVAALTAQIPTGNSSPPQSSTFQLTTPVTSFHWGEALSGEVVRVIQRGEHRVLLHLNPVELGPLSVDIRVSDQQAQLQLLASSPLVRAALDLALPQLRDALASQGIALGETHIGDPGRGGTSHQQRPSDFTLVTASSEAVDRAEELPLAAPRHLANGAVDLFV